MTAVLTQIPVLHFPERGGQMEGYKNKALRGAIMAALRANSPMGDHLIKMLLEDTPYEATLENIKKELEYLEDKKYIELSKVSIKEIGVSRVVAKLTSRGRDLLEGTLPPDGGVVMPDE